MQKNWRTNTGFTLIELMIVIAILAVLLAIAIPAYQNYSIRAANSECLSLATDIKTIVSETAQSAGINSSAVELIDIGITAAQVNTPRCTLGGVSSGVITIESTGAAGTSSGTFRFEPTQTTISASIRWNCVATHSTLQHVPAECRV